MYEMKVEKKPMIRHGDTRRSSMPSPVLRSGNRFAGRDMKLGHCSAQGTGSVLQMQRCMNCGATLNACKCGDYEPDDSGDTSYCENQHEQYLSAPTLRRNLNAGGKSGEAHHIFPGNIVRSKNLDNNGRNKDTFNEAWNGIMLNGTRITDSATGQEKIKHQYSGDAPSILHRNDDTWNHNQYDRELCTYIGVNNIQTVEDCQVHAPLIRESIENSGADCLDNM
mgnify:FL=1